MRKKNKNKNSHKEEAEIHDNEQQHSSEAEQGEHNEEGYNNRQESYGSRNIDDIIRENKELSESIAKHRKKMCEDKGIC